MAHSDWSELPEPLLIAILQQLDVADIFSVCRTCVQWNSIARDDYLWRQLFRRDFRVAINVALRPGAESWFAEYRRLLYNVPLVLTEDVKGAHAHQVLHVSSSHDGSMFATCSKDGQLIVWNASYPVSVKYTHDMKAFNWKHTQYSEFNASDTLIMVSGVYKGSQQTTSGEIAVFSVVGDTSQIRCRVVNRPFDIFGTWFSDRHLLSGDLQWLGHLVSTSVVWLNRANRAADADLVPVMRQLYKFRNRNASSVRALLVANVPWLGAVEHGPGEADIQEEEDDSEQFTEADMLQVATVDDDNDSYEATLQRMQDMDIRHSGTFRRAFGVDRPAVDKETVAGDNGSEDDEDLRTRCPKLLIFLTGSSTYSPHQIGFKFIDSAASMETLLREREVHNHPATERAAAHNFDQPDRIIDLHGHIIGMALSPDHRHLYVNSRRWPSGCCITNVLEPPPIAQEVDIHVIDLRTLRPVGGLLSAHRAYTPTAECFFLFPDVCDDYVASGAEDMHAYVWDRFYGICLAKYRHSDVVNSVAFNARDAQTLVTVSDDYTIKVWRSLQRCAELGIEEIRRAVRISIARSDRL